LELGPAWSCKCSSRRASQSTSEQQAQHRFISPSY
jgi:hypothetical protein